MLFNVFSKAQEERSIYTTPSPLSTYARFFQKLYQKYPRPDLTYLRSFCVHSEEGLMSQNPSSVRHRIIHSSCDFSASNHKSSIIFKNKLLFMSFPDLLPIRVSTSLFLGIATFVRPVRALPTILASVRHRSGGEARLIEPERMGVWIARSRG